MKDIVFNDFNWHCHFLTYLSLDISWASLTLNFKSFMCAVCKIYPWGRNSYKPIPLLLKGIAGKILSYSVTLQNLKLETAIKRERKLTFIRAFAHTGSPCLSPLLHKPWQRGTIHVSKMETRLFRKLTQLVKWHELGMQTQMFRL